MLPLLTVASATASSLFLAGLLLASPLLAQTSSNTCSDLSRDNPTLYRPDGGGTMHCLDWDQVTCAYVERPCRPGELGLLCYYIPMTCSFTGPMASRHVAVPAARRKILASRPER
jgi:hypothetical protein